MVAWSGPRGLASRRARASQPDARSVRGASAVHRPVFVAPDASRCVVDKSCMLPNANNAECECKVEQLVLGVSSRLRARVSDAKRGISLLASHSGLRTHDDYAREV